MTHYNTLGVAQNASPDEIRKAYYTLCRNWHPDRNKSSEASDKSCDINIAYGVLGNPENRKAYDLEQREKQQKSQRSEPEFNNLDVSTILSFIVQNKVNLKSIFEHLRSRFSDQELIQLISILGRKLEKLNVNNHATQSFFAQPNIDGLQNFIEQTSNDHTIYYK